LSPSSLDCIRVAGLGGRDVVPQRCSAGSTRSSSDSEARATSAMQRDGAQQADLKALWAGAYEAWRHVPGHPEKVVCLIPEEAALAQGGPPLDAALPAAVHNNVLFGLTSWNPMGEDAPMEQNLASYPALLADLRALQPAHIWQSYGFDSSGYRENGFTVAFPADRAAAAREATVEVAKKYGQGAVYELTSLPGDPSRILRRTVPALVPDVDADVVMARCALPEHIPGADPDLHFPLELR